MNETTDKKSILFDPEKLNYAASLSRAAAHPLRIKILQFIDKNPFTPIKPIYKYLDLEQTITSAHISIIEECGLVKKQKEGKHTLCSINYELVNRLNKAIKGL